MVNHNRRKKPGKKTNQRRQRNAQTACERELGEKLEALAQNRRNERGYMRHQQRLAQRRSNATPRRRGQGRPLRSTLLAIVRESYAPRREIRGPKLYGKARPAKYNTSPDKDGREPKKDVVKAGWDKRTRDDGHHRFPSDAFKPQDIAARATPDDNWAAGMGPRPGGIASNLGTAMFSRSAVPASTTAPKNPFSPARPPLPFPTTSASTAQVPDSGPTSGVSRRKAVSLHSSRSQERARTDSASPNAPGFSSLGRAAGSSAVSGQHAGVRRQRTASASSTTDTTALPDFLNHDPASDLAAGAPRRKRAKSNAMAPTVPISQPSSSTSSSASRSPRSPPSPGSNTRRRANSLHSSAVRPSIVRDAPKEENPPPLPRRHLSQSPNTSSSRGEPMDVDTSSTAAPPPTMTTRVMPGTSGSPGREASGGQRVSPLENRPAQVTSLSSSRTAAGERMNTRDTASYNAPRTAASMSPQASASGSSSRWGSRQHPPPPPPNRHIHANTPSTGLGGSGNVADQVQPPLHYSYTSSNTSDSSDDDAPARAGARATVKQAAERLRNMFSKKKKNGDL